jgi:hypothetical protein
MIDPLDKILDKLNNDDMLSDISDDEYTTDTLGENYNNDENEIKKTREKLLETYNDVKKCCIEIFIGYLILIDTNDTLITKNHNKLDSIDNLIKENEIITDKEKYKLKLQRLNIMYFNNILNDLKNDDILNIPEFIKLLTTKIDHNLECFIKLLNMIMKYILDMDLEWNLSKEVDIIDYNGKILIDILNEDIINLYLKYISHICK